VLFFCSDRVAGVGPAAPPPPVAQCVGAFLQADPLVACMNAYRHAGASRVDKML
jgi:hypothetical protein